MADAPYTPSIDELREGYASRVLDGYERNYEDWMDYLGKPRAQSRASFDRAIAAHVADEVERLADSGQAKMFSPAVYVGPERLKLTITARDWLRARAAEIRKEQ